MRTTNLTPREIFLERVRQAVANGNKHAVSIDLPKRGELGYQGAGSDLAARFCKELSAAGGKPHRTANLAAARDTLISILRDRSARDVILGAGAIIESLRLPELFLPLGIRTTNVADLEEGDDAANFFAADLSITGADYLIAETGSIVYLSRPLEPRSASLLPPVHVVVANENQLLPDLFDLFDRLPPIPAALPGCVSIITGPSKTGDIELKLVTGVHGPGELHVLLLQ